MIGSPTAPVSEPGCKVRRLQWRGAPPLTHPPTFCVRGGGGECLSSLSKGPGRSSGWNKSHEHKAERVRWYPGRAGRPAGEEEGGQDASWRFPKGTTRKIPEAWIQGRIQGTPASANEREKSTNASLSHPGTPPRTSLTAKPRTERGGGGAAIVLFAASHNFPGGRPRWTEACTSSGGPALGSSVLEHTDLCCFGWLCPRPASRWFSSYCHSSKELRKESH